MAMLKSRIESLNRLGRSGFENVICVFQELKVDGQS